MFCLIFICGCITTIAPKPIESKTSSYSGTNSNSGIISTKTDSAGHVTYIIITQNTLNKYNYLIRLYSKKFAPPLKQNAGITDLGNGTYQIDAEHFSKFAQMNYYWKNNIK